VLLRGKQPQDLEKYWGQFQDRQRDVQGILSRLVTQTAGDPALSQRIQNLRQEHQQLGVAYQKGRDAYLAAGADPSAGDAAVKGVDRAASEQMSALVSDLRAQSTQQSQVISAHAERTVMVGLAIMLLSGVLIGLFSLWLINRNLILPIRGLIDYVSQLSHAVLPSVSPVVARTNWGIWRRPRTPCATFWPKPSAACSAVPPTWSTPAVS